MVMKISQKWKIFTIICFFSLVNSSFFAAGDLLDGHSLSKSIDHGLLNVSVFHNSFQANPSNLEPYPGDMNTSFFDIHELAKFGQTAWGLATADFNHDGLIDFAVSTATAPITYSSITIFYNQGNLTFSQEEVYRFNEYIMDLEAADIDNDGDIDLLFTTNEVMWINGWGYYTNGTVNVLENTGDNQFKSSEMLVWLGPYEPQDPEKETNIQLACADYDKDDDIDFVIGSNSGKVELFVNDGFGNFSSLGVMYDYGTYSWGVAAGDYNNDGNTDFIVNPIEDDLQSKSHIYLKYNHGIPELFDNNAPGQSVVELPIPTKFNNVGMPPVGPLASIDYNNDGLMDFLYGFGIFVFLIIQQDEGGFEPFYVCRLPDSSEGYDDTLKMGAFTVGDFNNDGLEDVIVGGVQGNVRLLVNTRTLIDITHPQDMWAYRFGEDMGRKFKYPGTCLVLGDITIQTKELELLSKVEFYVDNTLMFTDDESPFEWKWNRFSFGQHIIKAKAYDLEENIAGFDSLKVWKFL